MPTPIQVKPFHQYQPLLIPMGVFISGCLLPLAFSPFNYFIFAILCPCFLLASWLSSKKASRTFLLGWLFGLGQFGVGVSWVYVSIRVYGETPSWFAACLTLLFISVLALYPALQGYIFTRFFPKNTFIKRVFLFPATWVITEYLRSTLFSGFPWLLLGASQTESPFSAWLPVVGIYGLAFLLTLIAALLLTFIHCISQYRKACLVSSCLLLVVFSLSIIFHFINWTKNSEKPVSVSLIQGNIARHLKWSPTYVEESLKTYQELTENQWRNNLIIWPESAITLPFENIKDFLNSLSELAMSNRSTLITGIPFAANSNDSFFNGMITLGMGKGQYHKRVLVPFGEYLPLKNWLEWIFNFINLPPPNVIAGSKKQPLLQANAMKIAPFICYEIAFNSIVRNNFPEANLIVTISDDAWFGDSLAPAQHLQIAQAQSLQTGRYQLTTTNNGITAIIDDHGHIQSRLPAFKQDILRGYVDLKAGSTPWIRWGDYPIFIISLLICLMASLYTSRR